MASHMSELTHTLICKMSLQRTKISSNFESYFETCLPFSSNYLNPGVKINKNILQLHHMNLEQMINNCYEAQIQYKAIQLVNVFQFIITRAVTQCLNVRIPLKVGKHYRGFFCARVLLNNAH